MSFSSPHRTQTPTRNTRDDGGGRDDATEHSFAKGYPPPRALSTHPLHHANHSAFVVALAKARAYSCSPA